MTKKLLFFVSDVRYFLTHRFALAVAAQAKGYTVALVTRQPSASEVAQLHTAGITLFALSQFHRSSLNPWQQWQILRQLNQIYRRYRPDIVHHVALKPVVLGSVVALWQRVPRIINALGGLGHLFTPPVTFKKRALRGVLKGLFHLIFSRVKVIVQNAEDKALLGPFAQVVLIPGVGVDPQAFPALPPPSQDIPIRIACVCRMLKEKGIHELVEAARVLRCARITLYGEPDEENPSSLTHDQLEAWRNEGIVDWAGYTPDIVDIYTHSHIAVLPSYREGLPKSLLEAASCGRPIVTTDVPGCRDVVVHGLNGLVVPPQDPMALADALLQLAQNSSLREAMGAAGRQRVLDLFTQDLIHQKTLALYQEPY